MTANIAMFIGAFAGCLIADLGSLHAQSPAASITLEGDNAPWNRGVPVADREAARELFLEGNRLFKIPLFTKAAEKYTAAIEQWKHPAFYFNLALTQLNLGQDLEAHDNLEQALKYGKQPLGVEEYTEARKQLEELERQLSHIRITCPTQGAEISLDGTPVLTGPGGYEQWVKPRSHEVIAKKPEYVTQSRRLVAAPGKREVVELSLSKLVEERPWATWKPWAVFGGGAAIVAASGALHALSAHNFGLHDREYVDLPCASTGCTDQQIDAAAPHLNTLGNHAKIEQGIAVGGYIVGGSMLAVGAVLLYMNRPHLAERRPAAPSDTRITIVPQISADALTVLVSVSH
jgi:hypothetical protein